MCRAIRMGSLSSGAYQPVASESQQDLLAGIPGYRISLTLPTAERGQSQLRILRNTRSATPTPASSRATVSLGPSAAAEGGCSFMVESSSSVAACSRLCEGSGMENAAGSVASMAREGSKVLGSGLAVTEGTCRVLDPPVQQAQG